MIDQWSWSSCDGYLGDQWNWNRMDCHPQAPSIDDGDHTMMLQFVNSFCFIIVCKYKDYVISGELII